MSEFRDKVVVITGAGKGQGRSHALAFAQRGARIVACDIAAQIPCASPMATEEQLLETARMIESIGGECITVIGDTRRSDDMHKLVGTAIERFGGVDVFIANAGIASFGPLRDMPYDVWRDVVDVNLTGVATSIRAVVPHMVERRAGRIVATASAVGREGGPNNANYAAGKWGVIGFVKSLAIELAPRGITVNSVAPGWVAAAVRIGSGTRSPSTQGEKPVNPALTSRSTISCAARSGSIGRSRRSSIVCTPT